MSKRTYIKLSGILLLFAGSLVIGTALFLPRLMDVNAYRDEIMATLQKALDRPVDFKSGSFAWHLGPSFDFEGVTVKEKDSDGQFLKAERVTVHLALMPLLKKQVVLKNLGLDGAEIRLVRDSTGRLNIDDLLRPSGDSAPIRLNKLKIRRGVVSWHDMAIQKDGFRATARNITLELEHFSRGSKGDLKLAFEVPALSGPPARLSLHGSLKLPPPARPLSETEANCDLDLTQGEIGRFWPYFGRFIPFANAGGRLDIASTFKGRLQDFSAKGRLVVSGASVVWPKIFHYTVAPRSLQLNYDLRLNPTLIDIPTVEVATEGFRIKGSFQIRDYSGSDPYIFAKASTPGTFRYEDVRSYVPYGIITPGTSDYIEHKIKSAVFRLDTGVLDGRASQIAHMEKGDNYKTLLIRGPVEKGVLSYGPRVPEFTNIKGTIELKEQNFSLIGMTAQFGESPLKMNGTITEYNTDRPSDYQARMEVSPRSAEIDWLARLTGMNRLEFGGASTLILNGSGPTSAYRLNGEWQLKQSVYSFPNAVQKPAGMDNRLTFTSVISADETRLTSLSYSLPPLMLSATALFRYSGQPFLGFELQTNQFAMGESLPILTGWKKYQPRGRVKAKISGSGNPEDFSAMLYSGSITLNGFSFQPGDKFRTVSGINGSIVFKGNSLETGSIQARYGDSPISLAGRVASLKNREANITLSSPQLFLRDINRALPRSDLAVRRLHGTVLLHRDSYELKEFSGQLNNSNFSISGTYTEGVEPTADVTVTSSRLDVEDLLLLRGPPAQPIADAPLKRGVPGAAFNQKVKDIDLKLKLVVENGRYARLPFSRLNAVASQESGILYLHDVSAGIFGGRLQAKGRVAPDMELGSRYDLKFNLERVNAERFTKELDITREVTGTLNVQGDITAKGNSLADIKKTALGNVRLKLEDGSLRRFSILSKLFSILNVSQLLKFQLPDMVTDGMPYNDIKGSFSVSDGVVSTDDLFINSDAINMSVIGKADIVREDLDFTIGVQPLQTVDKIVSRIPVVGWILTGKDQGFVTVYFEAKGKWSDPRVSAIPVSSMGKGVLNIFRRVFELPVRLFTDTGEVLLGK